MKHGYFTQVIWSNIIQSLEYHTVYDIGLPRYKNCKIRFCDKDSIPLKNIWKNFRFYHSYVISMTVSMKILAEKAKSKKKQFVNQLIIFFQILQFISRYRCCFLARKSDLIFIIFISPTRLKKICKEKYLAC